MTIDTVAAFVKAKVKPEHRGIVTALRAIMRERAPKASEAIGYGIPVWKGRHILAFIGSTKNDVTLGFSRGTRFEDKYGLLKGRGRVSRHLRFKTIEDVRKPVVGYYVRQALKLDAE